VRVIVVLSNGCPGEGPEVTSRMYMDMTLL
jgi:hypothetical protein